MKAKWAIHFRDQIEDEIAAGRLKPDAWLNEMLAAKRFSASRMPIREALQQSVR